MFSVCVLLYDDHHKLATRCLESIKRTADWRLIQDVRIGLNAVSKETRSVATAVASSLPVPCHLYEDDLGRNVWKYPLMRRMFNQRMFPLAPHVMWFDDDSYVTAGSEWWGEVASLARNNTLVGSVYGIGLRAGQVEGIKQQPWYTGKPVQVRPKFVTGGWWCLATSVIEEWNYPFPVLKHNGGDSILGELCHQQGYKIVHFNRGVAINADEHGRESKAVRRGDTTKWPWEGGITTPDYSHHDFSVTVRTFLNAQLVKEYVPPPKIIRTYE